MNLDQILQNLLDAQAAIADIHKDIDALVNKVKGTEQPPVQVPTPTPEKTSFQGTA